MASCRMRPAIRDMEAMPSIPWPVPSGSCQVYRLNNLHHCCALHASINCKPAPPIQIQLSQVSQALTGLLLGHMALHVLLPQRCVANAGEQP